MSCDLVPLMDSMNPTTIKQSGRDVGAFGCCTVKNSDQAFFHVKANSLYASHDDEAFKHCRVETSKDGSDRDFITSSNPMSVVLSFYLA
ncbi:hypothetical protein Nepgr_024598 [Nepenthes gracilis]|uniref:Uncharacterized protein n=1 Tax=Nepenthes gracilis TaxID=150966 RepID=A0AAD3Y079_NEPGR|nr:hypothetical protein Nepgr_024598 [Nepenthes gracilis]